MDKKLTGKVQTVLGVIDGEELGFTLPHEHLLLDLTVRFKLLDENMSTRVMSQKPVCFKTIGWIRFHAYENRDNLMLDEWFQKNRISTRDFELNDLNIFIGGNGAGI